MMSSPMVQRGPNCIACVRRIVEMVSYPSRQQVRWKKFVAKAPAAVKVQLLQNVPGYGKKGSIVPITPGVMRNIWYPRRMAGYVTMAKLQELGDITAERDFVFGTNKQRKIAEREKRKGKPAAANGEGYEAPPTGPESPINKDITPLDQLFRDPEAYMNTLAKTSHPLFVPEEPTDDADTPFAEESLSKVTSESLIASSLEISSVEQALVEEPPMTAEQVTNLFQKLIPRAIDFFREVEPETEGVSKSISSRAFVSAAVREKAAKALARRHIVGSVTSRDIEAVIQKKIKEHGNGKLDAGAIQVTLDEVKDIFTGIKNLGTYKISIRLGDNPTVVTKKIRVLPRE
ncbi:hypothetical protein BJ878DRAFT_287734 [Calycina marina]|uniref:Ribosomal protein L9 domain-containing protein n=1 Tax=Calycina marina TaxID=1763456 RepID=A0A9P7ZBH4_9HELO|nr:hypothetical protein BJ878DRAFT_287734 [Calycina marina]